MVERNNEVLHVGIDLGTSRSSISSSSGERHVIESYVGWPLDMVARKVLKKPVLVGSDALQNRSMLDLHRPLEQGLIKEGSDKDEAAVRELLWHLLLRGHDTFFLWCVASELPREIALMHEVYAAALEHRGFLERGTPVNFDVPARPGPVVSGLRLGGRVLVRRTDFGAETAGEVRLRLADGGEIAVPRAAGNHVVDVRPATRVNEAAGGDAGSARGR